MFTRSKMTTKLKIVINLAQVLVNVSWEMSKSAVSSSVQSLKYLSTGTKHCGAKSCQRQSASHIEHSHHDVFPGVFKPPCSFAYAAYQYQEFQSEKFFDSVPCILLNMCFIKKKKKSPSQLWAPKASTMPNLLYKFGLYFSWSQEHLAKLTTSSLWYPFLWLPWHLSLSLFLTLSPCFSITVSPSSLDSLLHFLYQFYPIKRY